jgi:hypothetical protein
MQESLYTIPANEIHSRIHTLRYTVENTHQMFA